MKKKNYISLLALSIASVLLFSFQNCSDVPLTKVQAPLSFKAADISGEVCSNPALSVDLNLNIIFVVDMSLSNIGSIVGGNSFSSSSATDIDGKRFDLIKQFVQDSNCLSNKNIKVATIGFSNTELPNSTICTGNRLIDPANIDSQLQYYKNLQNTDLASVQSSLANPRTMGATNFASGLDCANDIIQTHLSTKSELEKRKNFYQIIFLSDGIPYVKQQTLQQSIDGAFAMVDAIDTNTKFASGFVLQPILYGFDKLTNEDKLIAEPLMNEMSKAGNSSAPYFIDKVEDIQLCDFFKSANRVPYIVSQFGAINLTAHMLNGVLKADSDMDGIPDEDEAKRGFNPIEPRSGANTGNALLDGFCRTNASNCLPKELNECLDVNEFGISKCEIDEYNLSDGIDSDRDGIPDLIEHLKATNTTFADSHLDVDGDGDTSILEILKGRDPNFHDPDINTKLLLDVRKLRSYEPTTACPSTQERWTFESVNIPLVDTLAVNPQDPISSQLDFYKHEAGENVILVYYILQKVNSTAQDSKEIHGQFIKIKQNQSVVLREFKKLGEINAVFAPKPR